jgi:hypothetical protein
MPRRHSLAFAGGSQFAEGEFRAGADLGKYEVRIRKSRYSDAMVRGRTSLTAKKLAIEKGEVAYFG